MFERYKKRGYPREFRVRTKCILLFQTIHGVDVIIFGMYVYEYDHNCPPPNRRRVYISYLDSVNFFQPSEYRTFTYHTILVEYLRYVKKRGFHTAHIWACPPSKGDDFIFHIHPPHQKTSRDDMLCNWYHTMLATAEFVGVVIKTKTLYDEYFKPDEGKVFVHPTSIPYFEGDYIPGEVENIIEDLQKDDLKRCKQKDNDANISGAMPRMRLTEEKPIGNKRRTRSNPDQVQGLHMLESLKGIQVTS
jgi:E1A/CREB-binding protein